jgi:hypothetical protein
MFRENGQELETIIRGRKGGVKALDEMVGKAENGLGRALKLSIGRPPKFGDARNPGDTIAGIR